MERMHAVSQADPLSSDAAAWVAHDGIWDTVSDVNLRKCPPYVQARSQYFVDDA